MGYPSISRFIEACALALFATARPRVIVLAAAVCLLIPMTFQAVEARIAAQRLQNPAIAQQVAQAEADRAALRRWERNVYYDEDYGTIGLCLSHSTGCSWLARHRES